MNYACNAAFTGSALASGPFTTTTLLHGVLITSGIFRTPEKYVAAANVTECGDPVVGVGRLVSMARRSTTGRHRARPRVE